MAKHRRPRKRPRATAPTAVQSPYQEVLCSRTVLALVFQFQEGVFYSLLPRYRSWTRLFLAGALTALTQRELHLSSRTDPRFILHRAVFDGDMTSVRHLQRCRPHLFTPDVLTLAAAYGHTDTTAYLLDLGVFTPHAMAFAAAQGHLAVCELLQAMPSTPSAIDGAASNGHLAVVKVLHALSIHEATTDAMDGAAHHKHLDVVKYLHAHRTEGCTTAAMDSAALNGDLPMLAFFHSNRTEGCTTRAMDVAATHGYFEIVQFLHAHRQEGCTVLAMDGAATSGHADVVRFLHENRTEGRSSFALLAGKLNSNGRGDHSCAGWGSDEWTFENCYVFTHPSTRGGDGPSHVWRGREWTFERCEISASPRHQHRRRSV
ncbi:hypothetical protein, variant [Aphanomyces invadans]|uniref:Uncharacterized protein n=1 Tax=Aphanomyces invadans TaxID=157072 RepID=A0A024UCG7_9STRA|nr:hypothetical protein, variant [Aphanomyces invadans]ETW03934.1 hypothetical protein, variant [Aphanomyces invadans]|eukprot:XP_008866890.1 hypothetical protein, variant [Aphanomyces invadans]